MAYLTRDGKKKKLPDHIWPQANEAKLQEMVGVSLGIEDRPN